jgi:hypothetical protein
MTVAPNPVELDEREAAVAAREVAVAEHEADLAAREDRLAVAQQDYRETRATARRTFA